MDCSFAPTIPERLLGLETLTSRFFTYVPPRSADSAGRVLSRLLHPGSARTRHCPPGPCSAIPCHFSRAVRSLSLLRADRVFRATDRAAMPPAALRHADDADELVACGFLQYG